MSNAQYGTLGAWALSDAGIEIPLKYWAISDAFWRDAQNSDGSWQYKPGEKSHVPSMTIAGLASVFITADYVDTELRLIPRVDKTISNGLKWVDTNYDPDEQVDPYYLYGVERVGLASGYKFIGNKKLVQGIGLADC